MVRKPRLKYLTQAEFTKLRKEQWLKQGRICPILKQPIAYKDAVFDHKHKTKKEELGKDGAGLLRGVLHRQCNAIEGRIFNFYKRYGLSDLIDLPTLLRNIAAYIENPIMEQKYVHPNYRRHPKKLGKRQYNKICKHYFQMYPRRHKLPEFPKSGRVTKEFEELLRKVEDFL